MTDTNEPTQEQLELVQFYKDMILLSLDKTYKDGRTKWYDCRDDLGVSPCHRRAACKFCATKPGHPSYKCALRRWRNLTAFVEMLLGLDEEEDVWIVAQLAVKLMNIHHDLITLQAKKQRVFTTKQLNAACQQAQTLALLSR